MVSLLGSRDELLRVIERSLDSDVHVRGNEITITGAAGDNAIAVRLFEELLELVKAGQHLTPDSVTRALGILSADSGERPAEVLSLNILSRRGKNIRPKTLNQKRYVDAIDKHTVVFGIGPAGTGKTYLAVAKAVQALQAKQVTRIILTRPAVEAGERLGFLPGTLYDKIDPYLRPLLDALQDMLDPESIPRLTQAGTIEIAPLAYMRGRAQPRTALVATPQGFSPIGSLRVGDLVIGSNGLPTPVLGVYPQGRKQLFRVRTQDGASTLCCGEHLWAVSTPEDRSHGRPPRVLQTREMIGRLTRGRVHRYELPVTRPVEFEPHELPLAPYALGLVIADDAPVRSAIPSSGIVDEELSVARAVALEARNERGSVLVADPITHALRDLGPAGTRPQEKFIPRSYLFGSASARIALLQGLLDGGGDPVHQRDRTCRIHYATCSSHLSDDVVFLVRSLGGVACSRRQRDDSYALEIRLPADIGPFRLCRKQAVYRASGGGRPTRFIDSIEAAGEDEAICIQVAAADSLYVTDDFLVTHNTLNDAFIILDEAQNTTPEQMKMFLTRLGFGSKIVVTGDVTQVDLPGDTRSGLKVVRGILGELEDVHFANLTSTDVVRHRLVGEIVDAYERWDASEEAASATQHPVHQRPHRAKPRR
ncbi:MAG: PhoH family protein [Jatrophihabitantaceae bacterium]